MSELSSYIDTILLVLAIQFGAIAESLSEKRRSPAYWATCLVSAICAAAFAARMR